MKKVLGFLGGGIKAAAGLLGGDIATKAFEVVEAITGAAKTNPEMQKLLQNHEVEMTRLALQDAEGARLLIREAQKSEDWFIRRARPMFLWLMYVIFTFAFVVPVAKWVFVGGKLVFPELPSDLYYLFGAGYLGYSGLRQAGKNGWGAALINKLKNGDK